MNMMIHKHAPEHINNVYYVTTTGRLHRFSPKFIFYLFMHNNVRLDKDSYQVNNQATVKKKLEWKEEESETNKSYER